MYVSIFTFLMHLLHIQLKKGATNFDLSSITCIAFIPTFVAVWMKGCAIVRYFFRLIGSEEIFHFHNSLICFPRFSWFFLVFPHLCFQQLYYCSCLMILNFLELLLFLQLLNYSVEKRIRYPHRELSSAQMIVLFPLFCLFIKPLSSEDFPSKFFR